MKTELYIDEQFIQKRITELRMDKGVSEREMSLALGMCESYVRNITSSKSVPSLPSLLNICEYFGITPSEFFDPNLDNPGQARRTMTELERVFGYQMPILHEYLEKMERFHGDFIIELLRLR